jgi:hypothetical protein
VSSNYKIVSSRFFEQSQFEQFTMSLLKQSGNQLSKFYSDKIGAEMPYTQNIYRRVI